MIDQDLPHQSGGNAEEMRASFPGNLLPFDQPDERLVDQRARLHGMTWPLAAEVAAGERPELLVHVGQQAIEGRLTALAPFDQEVGELSPRAVRHDLKVRVPEDMPLSA